MLSESEILGVVRCCAAAVFDVCCAAFVVPDDDRRNSSRHFWNTRYLRDTRHFR